MSNDFLLPAENYVQRINPIPQYVQQAAIYLSIHNALTYQEAKKFVIEVLKTPNGKYFKDPEMVYFERNESHVRQLKRGTLTQYLRSAIDNKEVIVPTLTTYVNPEVHESLISKFMKRNADRRGKLKKQAQTEEQRGNMEQAYNLNMDQDNAKRNNNSMSGVMAAIGSIFENPTGHNTLTSMTRSMSSFSNGLNERMISGNRHYFNSDIAINNLTAIIATMDTQKVAKAIRQYNLAIPTARQVADMVYRSSRQYWRDSRHIEIIEEYAQKMTPEQRCAVMYTQDLYHTRLLNEQMMRQFIDDFSGDRLDFDIQDPIDVIKTIDPLITNYAHQIHITTLRGADKDYKKWPEENVHKVAKSCLNIAHAVSKYKLFIEAFLVVPTVPCSTAHINHMNRKAVVLSDTDSTMFAVDEWVMWYFGDLRFTDHAFAVAGAIMFVSTQLIAHAMAILSANMNVKRDKLFVLAMKPEYVFPVFAQTPVAKHYFCSQLVKEGAVYKKNKYEIKGVHLKNSASPLSIVGPAQDWMKEILDSIEAGRKLDLLQCVKKVASVEKKIYDSVMSGESEFYKKMFIKEASAYGQGPDKSPFKNHTFWNEVFAASYGPVEVPPYTVIKIPITTTTKTKFKAWVDKMQDRKLAERLQDYMTRTNRAVLKTLYISRDFVDSYGMPKEIRDVIDVKKIILDLTVIFRMILETIGYRAKVETLLMEHGY